MNFFKTLALFLLAVGVAVPSFVLAEGTTESMLTDLPKTNLSIGAPIANRILRWANPQTALNTIVVEEYNASVQSESNTNTKLLNQLKLFKKSVPKNIISQADAENYLKTHPEFQKKIINIFVTSFSSDFAAYAFNPQSPKLRIWRAPFNKSELLSLPRLLPSFLNMPMWSAGSTGIAWLSYNGNTKKLTSAQIHWYDFSKRRDIVLGKLNIGNAKKIIELHADYDMFSVTVDDHIDVWDAKARKIVKSFDKRPAALGFGSPSHYLSWVDNTVSTVGYYTINNLVGISGAINYFYIENEPTSDNQVEIANPPNSNIHIYGNHIILVASGKVFDYDNGLAPKNVDVDQKILDTRSSSLNALTNDFYFDGSKLIFYGGSPSRIFVQPIEGGTASEYNVDEAGTFLGFTGKYVLFKPMPISGQNTTEQLPNDPFGFKAMEKSLTDQSKQLKKGTAIGSLMLYQLP